MIPPDCPINVMSSFLSRSLRRSLHTRHEGMIVKSLSAGQNIEVSTLSNPQVNPLRIPLAQVADNTWEIIRAEGAVIEEAVKSDDDSSLKEKADEGVKSHTDPIVGTSFNEKSDELGEYQAEVVEIHPDDHPPQAKDG
jgi:hypothetical protein